MSRKSDRGPLCTPIHGVLPFVRLGIGVGVSVKDLRRHGDMAGLGGGYRFCTLGEPLFDELGQIRDGVKFPDLECQYQMLQIYCDGP